MCKVIYHPKYSEYDLGPDHPFSPLRVEMVIDLLHELDIPINFIEPEPVKAEELEVIHSKDYIQVVEALSKGENSDKAETFGFGSQDNPIVLGMAEGARYQAGGTLLGAKLLVENKASKVLQFGGGFHHAHKSLAAGFCIYNDLALAIKYMTDRGWHVAYLDVDVHHGDGVQEMFYSDENVMTISMHESGEYLFPGTGWLYELGQGMGRSMKLNLPLEPFTEGDSYLEVLEGTVIPALEWFRPDAIVIQTGADPHFSDPLADLLLTTQDFERLFNKIFQIVDNHCNGKALFTLGGGYSITATSRIWTLLYLLLHNIALPNELPEEWRKRWEDKLGKPMPKYLHDTIPAYDPIPRKPEIDRHNKELIQRLMDRVSGDWL